MKNKLVTLACAAALGLAATPSIAGSYTGSNEPDPAAVAADAVLGRPGCFVATVVGSAIFVVTLPVALTSHSVHRSAQALVLTPAWATFSRPLGDFSYGNEPGYNDPPQTKLTARNTQR